MLLMADLGNDPFHLLPLPRRNARHDLAGDLCLYVVPLRMSLDDTSGAQSKRYNPHMTVRAPSCAVLNFARSLLTGRLSRPDSPFQGAQKACQHSHGCHQRPCHPS